MLTEDAEPLCTAPFTSFLVDTNKGVRPCCVWEGEYLGNLKESSITDIINGTEWIKLKRQLMMGLWPKGCLFCKHREEATGWSVRNEFTKGGVFYSSNWRDITYIEFNSSNICNLACMHCSGGFSTSWLKQEKALDEAGFEVPRGPKDNRSYRTHETHAPDKSIVHDIIESVDLQNLEQIMIKGGEPMLNSDVEVLLTELDSVGILSNLVVNIVSNGTMLYADRTGRIFNLLQHARSVHFDMSVDGVGESQKYIRFGDGSDVKAIEAFMQHSDKEFNQKVKFSLLTSVMAYNVFYLEDIVEWWKSLPFDTLSGLGPFRLFVIDPPYLSVSCLSKETRYRLADYYEKTGLDVYENVIETLRSGETDQEARAHLINFTRILDEYRGTNFEESLPEFAADFK
jgi:MoaA/NifB/PqqE/SkfB family radical SAM enzyme